MDEEIRDEEPIDPDALEVDDDVLDDGEEELGPEVAEKKKEKDLIDPEDTESLDDAEDEELGEEDEPFDDITNY
jgi:hypothetical protein